MPIPLANRHSHLRDILSLGVPAMLAQAGQPLLNIGETAMIGRLGAEALAARAIGAAIVGAVYWVFAFLTFGSASLIGHHFGARDLKACGETYWHALWMAFIGGLLIALGGNFLAEPLYRLMGAEPAVASPGAHYFRIYIASTPLTLMVYASIGFFRGIQDTRTPMLIAFAMVSVQLSLGYGLIYGELGLPRWDLAGAAVAAWTAQLLGTLIYLGLFFGSARTAAYRAISWRIRGAGLRPLFQIGKDLAIRTGALRLSLIFGTSMAARMGAATLSAYEIIFQLFMLCSDVVDGLAIAGQSLVAKHLGAGAKSQAYRMGRVLIRCGLVAGLCFAIAFAAGWAAITRFFTTSPEVLAQFTPAIMLLVCAFQPLNAVVFVLDGFLIGARDTRYLMWAMLIGGLAICIPLAWSALNFGWGLLGIIGAVSALMLWRGVTNYRRFVIAAPPPTIS